MNKLLFSVKLKAIKLLFNMQLIWIKKNSNIKVTALHNIGF